MNTKKQSYSVINEVSILIKAQLLMMEIVTEDRRYRMMERNRIVCHCDDCVAATEATLNWLHNMRAVAQT